MSGCQIRIVYGYYGLSHACTFNSAMSLCGMGDLQQENTKWQPHWGFPDRFIKYLYLSPCRQVKNVILDGSEVFSMEKNLYFISYVYSCLFTYWYVKLNASIL